MRWQPRRHGVGRQRPASAEKRALSPRKHGHHGQPAPSSRTARPRQPQQTTGPRTPARYGAAPSPRIFPPMRPPPGGQWLKTDIPNAGIRVREISPLAAALAVVDVMRRLEECRPPELVAAGVARHPQMPHAPAPLVLLLRRGAQARLPPDLRHSRPQPVAEWAAIRLVIEHRYRHKISHAPLNHL
jgi:hypothetical protein